MTGLGTPTTVMFLTDALGSLLATFSNTAGTAAIQGNQVYGPYGNQLYSSQTQMDTTKGYTGQYGDTLTGLDYYVSRYYDPVAGVFLSADGKQGNAQGLNPYGYVGGNPETFTDPTGQAFANPGSLGGGDSQQQQQQYDFQYVEHGGLARSGLPVLLDLYLSHHQAWVQAESYDEYVMHGSTELLLSMEAFALLHLAGINWNASQALRELMVQLEGIGSSSLAAWEMLNERDPALGEAIDQAAVESADALLHDTQIDENGDISPSATTSDTGGPCSFTAATQVETKQGERAIGTLKAGAQVLAYNPKTKKMEDQPILHVWINHDSDLVDLTLTTRTHAPHSTIVTTTSEVIHTNQKHPFFTLERGFMPVGKVRIGMHVLRADGRSGVVTGYRLVPGTKTMYNLEVAHDHTFTVGTGQWIVHNSCGGGSGPDFPSDVSQTQHIFRGSRGHFADDTPANRQLIMDTASDSNNLIGTDRFGNDWYTSTRSDGSQVWVSVRGNVIQNAGLNDVPWSWDPFGQRLVPPSP